MADAILAEIHLLLYCLIKPVTAATQLTEEQPSLGSSQAEDGATEMLLF